MGLCSGHSPARCKGPTMSKPKILIVSTYRIKCGVASFTEVIRGQIGPDFDVDVYPLNQHLLRDGSKRANKAGDAFIRDLVLVAKNYDVVNLQWEPGFLGMTKRQILRRFKALLGGLDRVVITAHTVLPLSFQPRSVQAMAELKNNGWRAGLAHMVKGGNNYALATYRIIREAQATKQVELITHTRRDRRFFEKVASLANVQDHPLSHVNPAWAGNVSPTARETRQRLMNRFGSDSVLIGVFGFISAYKGIETAIAAARLLPANYHLLIYGGVHHVAIKERQHIDPYVAKLMGLVEGDDQRNQSLMKLSARVERLGDDPISRSIIQEIYQTQRPIGDRVHFMESPEDFEFAVAMSAMDICLFPYLEVGQSGSGPAAQAVELGKRVITTNNRAFGELAKYFPNRLNFFDVGNHVQLSQLIERVVTEPEPMGDLSYNHVSQRDFYKNVFNKLASAKH